jgi:hypothetical protein
MNLESWMSQASSHWKEFQPTRYKELVKSRKLEAALRDAAERTYAEMTELEAKGFREYEAWEMVRNEYLFPPPEAKLKAKWDQEPVASEAARMFNEIARLKSEILRGGEE